MLTRLRVDGFKNLVDVDVRFGPFTCIAGPNAVGKSNLFDAIRFLSMLASEPLMKAALSVRNQEARNADVRSIFHRAGNEIRGRMSFEVEMIAPREAMDDLGQTAHATANFLRYTLVLQYRQESEETSSVRGPIEILKEELTHIPVGKSRQHVQFNHTTKWRTSALHIKHRTAPFISTEGEDENRTIKLHQDGGSRGRALSNPATQPRTVLSVANAAESPTVLCAKREMESWRLLQLEPAALREPDNMNAPFHIASNGAHLAATLFHLAKTPRANGVVSQGSDEEAVYCQASNRLKGLIDDIVTVGVDRDEKRELLTLTVTGRDGSVYPARSLSDGTLRFLALAVLEMDPHAQGVVCLEEPENGIHPERIPAMLELLRDIATDPEEPVDETNPVRQVIVNTHSPAVVLEAPDDTLLVVEAKDDMENGAVFRKASFRHLPETWREEADPSGPKASKGRLLAYLNPVPQRDEVFDGFCARIGREVVDAKTKRRPRVADRSDLQMLLPHVAE